MQWFPDLSNPLLSLTLQKNRTKSRFPLQVERRNFTPEFSESPIFASLGGPKKRILLYKFFSVFS